MNIEKIIQNRMNEISNEMKLCRASVITHHELSIAYRELENLIDKITQPKFQLTKHREMWALLASNPYRTKKDVLDTMEFPDKLNCDCFACDYMMKRHKVLDSSKDLCRQYCPFKIAEDIPEGEETFSTIHCLAGLYRRWMFSDGDKRKRYAGMIRDLEVREGVICE